MSFLSSLDMTVCVCVCVCARACSGKAPNGEGGILKGVHVGVGGACLPVTPGRFPGLSYLVINTHTHMYTQNSSGLTPVVVLFWFVTRF